MRAVVSTPNADAPTELSDDLPTPEPGPEEALVRVRAFSVNRGELALLAARDEGWQPGQDIAGEVARAADAEGPEEGARVAGLADWCGWAEYVAVPAHRLAEIPEGVECVQAAALPMAGTTATGLVRQGGSLLGRRVLVTGASGGVGHIAVQLAAIAGAEVVAVASGHNAEKLRGWGASTVVVDPAEAPGVYDLVLESVGGESLHAAISKVAARGAVVAFGNSSREPTEVGLFDFAGGHEEASIETYFSARHEHQAGERLRMLLDLTAAGRLEVEVGFEASWERLNEALEDLAERRFAGKAVLTVD